ncbi:MAG TPA: putative metal-binding motif-containing protein [Myxococcota bacterium]|nr:putative metal-binding motif-containing protein [Myxococcota bacterium]
MFLYDGTDQNKIGIRQEWGGTVVYFGLANDDTTNLIDANDPGREVQFALYDPQRTLQGCGWNASCGPGEVSCFGDITYLGWNPVQGGNECWGVTGQGDAGSGIESIDALPGAVEIVANPMFWNPDWQSQDCSEAACWSAATRYYRSDVIFTQRMRFIEPRIAELKITAENLGGLKHWPTNQEWPTLYAAYSQNGTATGDYEIFINSAGQQISVDEPANNGLYSKNFESLGGWAMLQNSDLSYGVGIYYETRPTSFQAWYEPTIERGVNNIRALTEFGLPANGIVNGRAYLLLGSAATITSLANQLSTSIPPFGYLDSPQPEATVSSSIQVNGWVLDDKGISQLRLLLDGAEYSPLRVNRKRIDVCSEYPMYSMCTTVGFSKRVLLAGVSACHHLLEVEATDTDGNQRVIARTRIRVEQTGSCQNNVDCNDNDPCTQDSCNPVSGCTYTPGAGTQETCNGLDDNCDGVADEQGALGCTTYYRDRDWDGYGTTNSRCLCDPDSFWNTTQAGDCDDNHRLVSPGAVEVCNGKEDDCIAPVDPVGTCTDANRPIYRFVKTQAGNVDHMFAVSQTPLAGYAYEGGIAFQLFKNPGKGLVPLYQSYCQSCMDHMQTIQTSEGRPAYRDAEILGFCSTTQFNSAPNELKRLSNAATSDHFMSSDPDEWVAAQAEGYVLEGGCWVQ